jgi:hypothetical protein
MLDQPTKEKGADWASSFSKSTNVADHLTTRSSRMRLAKPELTSNYQLLFTKPFRDFDSQRAPAFTILTSSIF